MEFTQLEINGYVLGEHNPSWIIDANASTSDYSQLLPLLDFFVFENPNESLSSRARRIEQYGWINPWRKPTYLNLKLKDASNNKYLYYSAATLDAMEKAIHKAGLFGEFSLAEERACFYDNCHNQSLSCLYHLRNALCHGRFLVMNDKNGELWLLCEDISVKSVKKHNGKKLSARMALRISTLAAWKEIITRGPEGIEQQ